jgi:hypothetical protein
MRGWLVALGLIVTGCANPAATPPSAVALLSAVPAPASSTPAPTVASATIALDAAGTIPCVGYGGCGAVLAILPAPPGAPTLPPLIEGDATRLAIDRDRTDRATVSDHRAADRRLTAGSYLVVVESQYSSDVSSFTPEGSIIFAASPTGRCTAPLTVADGDRTITISIRFRLTGECAIATEAS